ncbi:MAG: hypothetical protein BGN88_13725 [Clostridiales bacterium 43-6]|nr:MAG: hypothetical protein BGN88_13725 [Clostridiales bacterium 43-6]
MNAFFKAAACSVKIFFRDRTVIIMMFVVPVVLMSILGMALDATFDKGFKINNFNVEYRNKSTDANLTVGFQSFIKALEENDVKFVKTDNETEGMKRVENNQIACLVVIDENNGIKLYKNSSHPLGGDILESSLKAFENRMNAIQSMMAVDPQKTMELIGKETGESFIDSMDKAGRRTPTSKEYYGVAAISMMLAFSLTSAYMRVAHEMTSSVSKRKFSTPANPYAVFLGSQAGNFVAMIIQVGVLSAYSIFVNGSNWGKDTATVISVLLGEAFLVVGFGGMIGCYVKDRSKIVKINYIIMIFAWFLNMFAGNFASIDNFNASEATMKILRLSPILKVNDAIFGVLYNNNSGYVLDALVTCFGLGLICIVISIMLYKRRLRA